MELVDRLNAALAGNALQAVEVTGDGYLLEVHPLHGKLGAGFTLSRRLSDGDWEVVATGHTDGGGLVTEQGEPLTLPDEVVGTIAALLHQAGAA